jgi:hypothetical protein
VHALLPRTQNGNLRERGKIIHLFLIDF